MKYATYEKAKDYSMNNVVPAFVNVATSMSDSLKKERYMKYANALTYCGYNKIIAHCTNCDTNYFKGMYTCKNRYCPVCQRRKSLILFSKVFPKIKRLIEDGAYVQLMTFTIKDTERLEDGLNLLKKAYRILAHENKEYKSIYESKFLGGIKSLEVKRGENSKLWHPHFHAIVVKSTPSRDREWLNYIWNNILRRLVNENPKRIYDDRYYSDTDKLGDIWITSIKNTNTESLVKQVYECVKYIAKFGLDLENDLEEMVDNLFRVRQIESWGLFRGIERDVENLEEQPNFKIAELVCKKCGSREFEIFDGISLEEFAEQGYDPHLEDFETTTENEYDDGEV